jgi:peptidyl-prolyl cis-trans isomerase D
MISFFRRALSSWLVLGLLSLVLLAFVITGVGSPVGLGDGGIGGSSIAKVGSTNIGESEAATRIQAQLDAVRQQQPGLDMTAYIRRGGADEVIDQMINSRAFESFGRANDMFTSKRLVDAELATIQAFKGPTGSFDRATFLQVLQQRKLSENALREDIARDKMVSAMIIPAAGAARMPGKLVAPYASLLLEQRSGQIAVVPVAAIAQGAPPSAAELSQYYSRNAARYTVPETRVIRYALFDLARFEGKVGATDAEIAAAYKANAARFAGKETRNVTQAVVQSEATARKIAAAARAGTPFETAAKAGGTDAVKLDGQDQSGFAGLTSAAAAKLAFGAAKGAILDPQKSPFGWNVIRVDSVTVTPGKSLADVRGEIATQLSGGKVDAAMADFVTKLEDAVADGGSFDDVAKANGLTIVTTPAVTGSGIAPDQPGYKADPALAPVLRDAFLADAGDDAAVLTVQPSRVYAFYDLDRVVPSAPRPLAQIKAQVTGDFIQDRALRAARKIADGIAAKTGGGTGLAAAVSGAGIALPAPRPVSVKRLEIAQAQGQVPRSLQLLFSMAPGKAKLLEMENKQGWYIVKLDSIVSGDATKAPGLIQATQAELARAVGEEYVQQFANAIRADRKVKKNDAAIARLKRSLTGAASAP